MVEDEVKIMDWRIWVLKQIDKLRRIINEGFDCGVIDGFHIEPDLEHPTIDYRVSENK